MLLSACSGAGPKPNPAPASCAQMNGMLIPATAIGLPSNGARITSATQVAAAGSGAAAVGEYCNVLGEISPLDPRAPNISFRIALPTIWNHKAMMFGGGGYDGTLSLVNLIHAAPTHQPTPLGRGYAVFGSDGGHAANPPHMGGRDGSFGVNEEALRNFASDALKKTRDTAMYVIQVRYAQAPSKTYFAGGSTGGREALAVAQKWPQDFDGVISMFPAWNAASLNMQFGRITRALAQPGGFLNPAKRKLVFDAAYALCDKFDGVVDGLISNVAACNAQFNPATATLNGLPGGVPLRCRDGVDSGDDCLSDPQIGSLLVMNSTFTFSTALASGETHYPGFNVWGTDLGNPNSNPNLNAVAVLGFNIEQPALPFSLTMPYMSIFWDQWAKYFITGDSHFNSLDLDPHAPGVWQARINALSVLQDVNRTDMSAFQAKGGKLLILHGAHDGLVSARASEEYVQRMQDEMGLDKVRSFARYYEVPGYGHSISARFNASWDSVTALENWVERGEPPSGQVVADSIGVPGRTRPLCEYPYFARYRGEGDVNLAASFVCSRQ